MADSRQQLVLRLLRENGAVLVRQRKHQVYRFPDGRTFVLASTPSDVNAVQSSLSSLKRFLGIQPSRKQRSGDWTKPRHRGKKTANFIPVKRVTEQCTTPTKSLPLAVEQALVQYGDFEALMLSQGVRKLEAA